MKINLKPELLLALEKNLGIVTPACKEVGISRNVFYQWYRSDEEFKKAVDDINDVTLDFAENQLLKKIKEGSERSILFYMRYKGRKRGYTEELNITANIKIEQPLLGPPRDDEEEDEEKKDN
jgi:hypothetical protein